MKHFRGEGATYKTRYNRKTGTNYVVVIRSRRSLTFGLGEVWYRFNPKTGGLSHIGHIPAGMR